MIARRIASARPPVWAAVGTMVIASACLFVPVSLAGAAVPAPAVSVDPPSGPPLANIKVSGAGFCPTPCSPVAISVNSLYVASDVTVAADGTFSTIIRMPGTAGSGQTSIAASQTDQNGTPVSASTQFDVTPSTPAPTQYPAPTAVLAPTGNLPGTTTTHGTSASDPSHSSSSGKATSAPPATSSTRPPTTASSSPAGSSTSPHPGNGVHTEAAADHGSSGGGSGTDWLLWAGLALLAVAAGVAAAFGWYRKRHAAS